MPEQLWWYGFAPLWCPALCRTASTTTVVVCSMAMWSSFLNLSHIARAHMRCSCYFCNSIGEQHCDISLNTLFLDTGKACLALPVFACSTVGIWLIGQCLTLLKEVGSRCQTHMVCLYLFAVCRRTTRFEVLTRSADSSASNLSLSVSSPSPSSRSRK